MRLAVRYVISKDRGPIGRLHLRVEPVYRARDNMNVLRMTLTARGAPKSQTIRDTIDFLDMGREWIVRGFAEITTSDIHAEWGRHDGN